MVVIRSQIFSMGNLKLPWIYYAMRLAGAPDFTTVANLDPRSKNALPKCKCPHRLSSVIPLLIKLIDKAILVLISVPSSPVRIAVCRDRERTVASPTWEEMGT